MKCPVCKEVDLVMSERQKIEIDYCPQCRGVWLDRGELDKIIERSATELGGRTTAAPPQPVVSQPGPVQAEAPIFGHGYDHGHGHDDHSYGKHRKKSLLESIFD
jgi:Zn-finger nucleic acid-binding protein